jgi:hypothetical protein
MTRRRIAFGLLYLFLALSVILEVWRWIDPGAGWARSLATGVSLVGLLAFILITSLGNAPS